MEKALDSASLYRTTSKNLARNVLRSDGEVSGDQVKSLQRTMSVRRSDGMINNKQPEKPDTDVKIDVGTPTKLSVVGGRRFNCCLTPGCLVCADCNGFGWAIKTLPKEKGDRCCAICCLFCNPLSWPGLFYRTLGGILFDFIMFFLGTIFSGCWCCTNCGKWKTGCCYYRDIYYDNETYGNNCCDSLFNKHRCCVPILLGAPQPIEGCGDCCCYPLSDGFEIVRDPGAPEETLKSHTCILCIEGALVSY